VLFGRDRICAVVAAATAREMRAQLDRALQRTRTVELRLDYLKASRQPSRFLGWLKRTKPGATLIATCRRVQAGGCFSGDILAQCGVLKRAQEGSGCAWVDLEIESVRERPEAWRRRAFGDCKVLISYHDFQRTPRSLAARIAQLESFGADAIKIATQCHSIADSLRVLGLAKRRRNVVAVPMGEIGLPARVLALRAGSALAYAAAGRATAPGQPTLEEMKKLYRAEQLNRRTRVYGVVGNPVSHSLSPLLHNVGFQVRKLNAVYLPFLASDLRDFLQAIEPLGIAGFSVTLPFKERILRHLEDCDPLAAAIGAVNTVVVRGGGELYGYNTDYVGVLRALERRVRLAGSRVLLYGAGGGARAVAFALAQGGASVCVCARRIERARGLARAVGGEAIERGHLRGEFFDAIINATPVGMHPHPDRSPLRPEELNCRIVFDLVYRPMKTQLLYLARRRGIETVSGAEMFVSQGTGQWEIWTGLRAPVAAMRRAVWRALEAEERTGTVSTCFA
jgi:3-dehydroquinate dehydratase/shikimate dehydrogenase